MLILNKWSILTVTIVISTLILSLIAFPFPASAQNDLGIAKFNQPISDEFVPGQVVVGLKKSDPNFHANIAAKGGKVINTIDEINAFVVKVPEHTEDKFIFSILKNPIVDYAEKDPVLRAFYDPEDPFYTTYQWGMKRIGSESAWNTLTGIGSGVKVAVVDTGMNYNHVDLAGRVDTANGWDFVGNDSVPLPSNAFCYNGDWEWHATFVAGIIAGIDNDVGIVGASQVEIIPVRVLNNCGSGSSSNVANGILWAANNGADVINLSLGGRSSSTMQNAVITAYSQDVVIVASAGNSGSGKPSYPASYDEVISVSATDINDNLAPYSTRNDGVELTAPGGAGNSCSTLSVSSGFRPGGGWEWMCAAGTSFSAPHVSGVAALLWAQYQANPDITNQDIRNHLTLTAEDLGDSGRDRYYGYGMVRSDLAVNTPISGVSLPHNPPTANDDSTTTDEDIEKVIDVLLNDSNGDGTIDPTTVTTTSGPTNGQTLVDGASGNITYTPDPDYNGNDSFTYTVQDNQGATSNEASVTISVNPINDAPVANDDSATTTIDTAVTIDVTANDTDVDGTIDPTTVAILSGPSYGIVSVNPTTGVVTYTPNTSFLGTDSFVYEVADNDGATDSATVTITEPVNDPPIANNDSDTVDEGLSTITNVAANDVDVDDGLDLTSIMIVTSPLHGTLTVNGDGTVTYAHDGIETTSDSYTYNIKDASGQISNDATVSITIIADTESLTASLTFSHEVKGKSGSANLFVDVTVSGSSGQTVTVDLELFKSDGTRVGTGSGQLNGDGTITFKYNQAQCGMQYRADTTTSTTSGGSAFASETYLVVC